MVEARELSVIGSAIDEYRSTATQAEKTSHEARERKMSNIVFKERNLALDALIAIFALSSWVEINGLWVQTPVLVRRLPEGWQLASYIIVITQLANVGPIAFSFMRRKFQLKTIEVPSIHVTLLIGTLSCILLSIFWNVQTSVFGSNHSVVFFILTACLATIDCTTSVLYLPFISYFKSKYLVSYITGEGLSGVIPSVVSLIQGVGGNPVCKNVTRNGTSSQEMFIEEPRFSVGVFFGILCLLVCLSWISFTILHLTKIFDSEKEKNSEQTVDTELINSNRSNLSITEFRFILFTQLCICSLTNGILPSIQTYSCLPYGDVTNHLAVSLAVISNPIASFLSFLIHRVPSLRLITCVSVFGALNAIYITTMATLSPNPPLRDSVMGSVLIVSTWILFSGSMAYARALIASLCRISTQNGHKSLFWRGVFTQLGSATGAIIIFALVNGTSIFISSEPCS